MSKFSPPKLLGNIICITSTEVDIELIASVSSYFNEKGVYLVIFDFPPSRCMFRNKMSYKDDDYLSHVIGNTAKTKINNAISMLPYEQFLLVGLDENQKTYFKYLRDDRVTIIDSVCDIETYLSPLHKVFDGEIRCKRGE